MSCIAWTKAPPALSCLPKVKMPGSFFRKNGRDLKKKYHALVHGKLSEKEGIITSYLAENRAHKMYSIDDPAKGKLARTGYKVLRESRRYSLLEVNLLTGRKNQIRVHLADRGCPVAGDKKYGAKKKWIKRLTLHASSITILHPHSKEKVTFTAKLPAYFETLMK